MSEITHSLFDKIVLEGVFSDGGMASFADTLSEADVEAIHTYVIFEQHQRTLDVGSEGDPQPPSGE